MKEHSFSVTKIGTGGIMFDALVHLKIFSNNGINLQVTKTLQRRKA